MLPQKRKKRKKKNKTRLPSRKKKKNCLLIYTLSMGTEKLEYQG